MRFSLRCAWILAFLGTTPGCDPVAPPPDAPTPELTSAQRALVAGSYYLASNNMRGMGSEYLPGAGADLASVDGKVLMLHVPASVGGTRIYQMDPLSKTFADATASLAPSKWGILEGYADGAFVDLNNDGFKDILLIRDKGAWDTIGLLYDPITHIFRTMPFDRDLDFDGDRSDEIATFFGHSDISYHARRIVVADLDGDGDEDLFIGRRRANYVFENLSAGAPPWDYVSPNVARFAAHQLDSTVTLPDGTRENQVQLTVTAVAYAPADGGPRRILAADSVCVGSYCADSLLSANLYVHDYGLSAPNACAPNNGVCERGEEHQAGNPDCDALAGGGVGVSCRFGDRLRRIVSASATAVAALDRDSDGFTDFLVFGGAPDVATENAVVGCFRDPAQAHCNTENFPTLDKLEIRGAPRNTYAPTTPAPWPFVNRWALFADVRATTALDADPGFELATYAPRTKQAIGSPTATAVGVLDVAADGTFVSPECSDLLLGDDDPDPTRFMLFDLDRDGRMDFHLVGGSVGRTYWGNVKGTAGGHGCLLLDARVPLTSRNLQRPVLADLDRDGDLDMVMQAWTDSGLDSKSRMFLRNTGGRFTDVTASTIGALPTFYGGSTLAFDIDNDGDKDLVFSNNGPLQVFRNDGRDVWTDVSAAVLPAWYTTGGSIHGANYVPCDPYPVDAAGKYNGTFQRCYPAGLVVGDFDGNKGLDIAVVSRKGANDILFNNLTGPNIVQCPADRPWCARVGFLSARTDLAIRTVLPTTNATGLGSSNRSQRALAVDLDHLGKIDLLVLGSPSAGYDVASGEYDRAFVNGISAPFPHADACADAAGCRSGEACVAYGNMFPDLRTCWTGGNERIENGWFSARANAIPTRDPGPVVDRFGGIACAASGDLNADGHTDFIVATAAGESNLDTTRDAIYLPDGTSGPACAVGQGNEAELTDCDVVYECKRWKCSGSNPEGDERWTNPLPETDPRCCVAIPVVKDAAVCGNGVCEATEVHADADEEQIDCPVDCPNATQVGAEVFGRYVKSATCAAGKGNLEYCDVKGYQKIGTYGPDATLARAEAAIFVYLGRNDGAFTKYKDPITLPAGAAKDSLYMSCDIADFNADGRRDFFVTGYLMGDVFDAVSAHMPTPAGLATRIRRYASTQPTRMWLNPGWDKAGVRTPANTPATAGPFPMRSDKVYGSAVGNLDSDASIEIITTGVGVNIFDRK